MEKRLDQSSWPQYRARLDALTAETPREWGTMMPNAMLRHLRYMFDLSLEREKARDVSLMGVRRLIYWCFFRKFTTWPGGKIKAPSYFMPSDVGSFEDERSKLIEVIQAFLVQTVESPARTGVTPLLGPMTMTEWTCIHGAHCDHHLRQFGV